MTPAVRRFGAGLVMAGVLLLAPPAHADPTQEEQCRDATYAKLHQFCQDPGAPFLLGGGYGGYQGGGGAGGGGLLGTIGRVLGGITSGIL